MPPIIVSLINLKGGVGKTTTTVQLAECLASEFGKRVLVIDLDPQTNATIALVTEERWEELSTQGRTVYHLFHDRLEGTAVFDINRAIVPGVSNLGLKTLSLLASSIQLIDVQDRMKDIPEKTGYAVPTPMEVLKLAVGDVLGRYDYVLVDCPPNLGYITRNGIEISDFYLIPTIPDTLSTYGIPQIVRQISRFARERRLKIRCLGLVVTKYYSRSRVHENGVANLPARFNKIFADEKLPPAPVFGTKIPLSTVFADVPDVTQNPSTFKEKYGRGEVAGKKLHEYVSDLTKEFMTHAGR